MPLVKGKGASPGTAFGVAYLVEKQILRYSDQKNFDRDREMVRWKKAHQKVLADLNELKAKFRGSAPQETLQIIEAHQAMVEDPEWMGQIEEKISEGYQSEYSVKLASENFALMIEALDDPYLRQRAQDIRDVASRISQTLLHQGLHPKARDDAHILVAEDLLPSELLNFYGPDLKGIVLEQGNPTSHTTILARTFELPLVLRVSGILSMVRPEDDLIVDGLKGSVVIRPMDSERKMFQKQIEQENRDREELAQFVSLKSVTQDGICVEVASNLNSELDVDFALRKGSDGVGLFRTEFLLMDRSEPPTEDEQYQIYKKVLEAFGSKRVVIRTFDIGGDKQIGFLRLPSEANPFLGCRGIRFCLKNPEFFKTQLRALLRASSHGNLGIMIPMVSCLEEVQEFTDLIRACAQELEKGKMGPKRLPEVGVMIEVPSLALIADQIAPYVDFMSVGTNDLVQYLCAADRMNSAVADLHDTYHPGLLRILKQLSDLTRGKRLWLGMCGELAAQEDYIPLLLALGFVELSVSPGAVLRTRRRVIRCQVSDSRRLLECALSAKSSSELKDALKIN